MTVNAKSKQVKGQEKVLLLISCQVKRSKERKSKTAREHHGDEDGDEEGGKHDSCRFQNNISDFEGARKVQMEQRHFCTKKDAQVDKQNSSGDVVIKGKDNDKLNSQKCFCLILQYPTVEV